MADVALSKRLVYYIDSTFNEPSLIGVLNPEDKGAACMPGYQVCIKSGAKIANMHVACGRRGKSGAYLPLGDARFHFFEPCHIFHV